MHTIPLYRLDEDQLSMRRFLYTLKDRAKSLFITIQLGSLTICEVAYNKFMDMFYFDQETSNLRAKIATLF